MISSDGLRQALDDLGFTTLCTMPGDSSTAARYDDEHRSIVVTLYSRPGWRVDAVCHDSHQRRELWTYTVGHPAALPVMLTLLRAVTAASAAPTPTHHGPDPSEGSNWSPGFVTLPGVGGPYPALLADFLTVDGWAVARFTDETVRRIATDCDRLAERVGEAAGTARIRARPTGGFDVVKYAGTAEETVIAITADAENHYLLRGWCWHPTE